ncbi:MAG: hypothetical protein Q9225_007399, partial [Loekoesia sp. 1 TL-2023]
RPAPVDKTIQLSDKDEAQTGRSSSGDSIPIAFKLTLLANEKGHHVPMFLHMRRRLAKIFTQRGQDCMLALTLQHGVFMDLDRVKTGPSSGEMWGFTASRK